MALDAERYRREVLDPARQAGNRPPDDLIARYQLTEPLGLDQVRVQVEATLAHWRKQRSSLAYRKVIDALEAEHRQLRAVFDGLRGNDLRPLRDEIERSRDRRRLRTDSLRNELGLLAGAPWMLLPDAVEQMAAQGYDPADVRATIQDLRIEVREPDDLPPVEAPMSGFGQLREDLRTLRCRHIADFLFGAQALADGFGVLDGFCVPGQASLRFDDETVRNTAERWARRLEGKTVPESVLSVLRRLSPDEREALLAYECAHELRRYLPADSAALERKALDLGLSRRDARRFVFAVATEQRRAKDRGRSKPQLAAQLEELLAQRRLVEAHRLVADLGDRVPAACQELAGEATRRGRRALELQEQARAAPDPETGWRLLDDAVALAADLPDVEQMRQQWPPAQPRTLTAVIDGARVLVRWSPSISTAGALRYVVRRSTSGAAVPGEIIAETAGTSVEDPIPPVNVPCSYSVVAIREGVASAAVRNGTPIWLRPEVAGLRVEPDDGLIAASWSVPAGASRVVARRAEGRPPRDAQDGDPVALHGNGFIDRRVRYGVTYHYLVTVGYLEPDGREIMTAGQRFTGMSVKPPQPVRPLTLEAAPDEPGSLVARFPPPTGGTVELREFDGIPPHSYGTRLPASSVPGRRRSGVPVAAGLKCEAPTGAVVLVAVTVNGERAVIGDHAVWVPMAKVPTVDAERRGDGLHLSWEWPPDVVEMEVRWRADEQAWHSMVVSHARYDAEGGVHLPRRGDRTEIEVAVVVRGLNQRRVGPPHRVLVVAPVAAPYTVRRRGLRRNKVVATVHVTRKVCIPRLLLLASMDDLLPLRATDGQVLAELIDVETDPVTPAVLRASLPRRAGPYFLRCFAPPGDIVELGDPPREQLRVR
jgi:hypothetical protein